jgi:hypothetical protein
MIANPKKNVIVDFTIAETKSVIKKIPPISSRIYFGQRK